MHQGSKENKTEKKSTTKRESIPESGKVCPIEWQSTSKREGKQMEGLGKNKQERE